MTLRRAFARLPLLALLLVGLLASACDSTRRPDAPQEQTPKKADHRALVAKGARLLDVRTPEEFAAGHVEGARNVPLDELEKRMSEAGPKDQPVVVYCQAGGRSAQAAKILRANGYTQVIDLGPMSAW